MGEKTIEEVQDLGMELRKLINRASALAGESGEDEAVKNLWQVVRQLLASAITEHWRLLGMDVTHHEEALAAIGSMPWRDVLVSDSDSTTTEARHSHGSPMPSSDPLEPSLQLYLDASGHLVLAVPLGTRVLPLAHEGGE